MPKYLIIDTNILFSYLYKKDGDTVIHKIIKTLSNEKNVLLISDDIFDEYEIVLYRESNGFDVKNVNQLLAMLYSIGKLKMPQSTNIPMIDESDRKFYDLYDTMRSETTFLITGNKKHYPSEINILTPREYYDKFIIDR